MEGNRFRRICISEWRMKVEDTITVYARIMQYASFQETM